MAKPVIDEVEVLRFFETESLDRATVLFNIVADKMRGRLKLDNQESPPIATRRRRTRQNPGTEHAESPTAEAAASGGTPEPR